MDYDYDSSSASVEYKVAELIKVDND